MHTKNLEGTISNLITIANDRCSLNSACSTLEKAIRNQHAVVLYRTDEERNVAAARYINEGLLEGRLCIYASVDAFKPQSRWEISNLSQKFCVLGKISKTVTCL